MPKNFGNCPHTFKIHTNSIVVLEVLSVCNCACDCVSLVDSYCLFHFFTPILIVLIFRLILIVMCQKSSISTVTSWFFQRKHLVFEYPISQLLNYKK